MIVMTSPKINHSNGHWINSGPTLTIIW